VKPSGTTLLGVRTELAIIAEDVDRFHTSQIEASRAARAVMDTLRERTASLVDVACHVPRRP
jgi:hypothetical protein